MPDSLWHWSGRFTELPKADQQLDEWQIAIEALMLVVKQNGPTMFARMGIMKALNRHVERVFNPDRKETHWGKIRRGPRLRLGPQLAII